MIPVQLRLKNFMCYRDNVAPLNFSSLHVACLCGDNGSGKSSIFDAMTWALWGEASRGKNDDLIYSGQSDMEVELEFLSGADRYRIIRKYSRASATRPPQTMLDLQLFNGDLFKPIAEHVKRETQAKINNLLHLDYPTFINSAMLLQGRSNEFSRKRPGERKEILANILDLSFYDQLEQEARTNADKNKSEAAILARDITALQSKISERPQHENNRNNLLEELNLLIQAKKVVDSDASSLRQRKDSLSARKEQLDLLNGQVSLRQKDLVYQQKQLESAVSNIERFNKVQAKRAEIEQGYSKLREAIALEEKLNENLKKANSLSNRRNKLESLITAAQNTYANEFKLLSARVTELDTKSNRLPQLQDKHAELTRHQEELKGDELQLESGNKQINKLTSDIGTLSALNSEIASAIQEIKEKIELMSHAGAACPLCESSLGPDGCQRLKDKLTVQLQQKLSQARANSNRIAESKASLGSLEKETRQRESSYKMARDENRRQLAITDKDISEINSISGELSTKRITLHDLEARLHSKDYARGEQSEVASIDGELKELAYDAAAHTRISQDRVKLQTFERLNAELTEARLQNETQLKIKEESLKAISLIQAELTNLSGQGSQIQKELAMLPQISAQLDTLDARLSELNNKERVARDKLAELSEKLNQLDDFAAEKIAKETLLRSCSEAEGIYSELVKIFSKRGIQALIIEETIPEIENEANLLLGKMTDNRMSISLETQKDTKKGSTIETLDIKIADELGTRSYEMYSGGEAFRIDLALRIAISRLLVRRAGASMPILIIDEGFGTQDNAGIEKLVEAINSIQDDFEKVFVITHLDEIKDRFPVLIYITKTAEGSMITLNQ